MTDADSIVISTKGLTKKYKTVTALQSLNLTVRKNQIYGFLGPNGAGKTTAIKLLLGLTRPTSGSGTVFGKDIVEESIEIRNKVGYLQQEARYYEYMTARQVLSFTLRFFFSGPREEIGKRVKEMLELVDLQNKANNMTI